MIDSPAWHAFITHEGLDTLQKERFKAYVQLLDSWNKRINLTAIVDIEQVIADHLQDSLRIGDFIAIESTSGIADVGSGGGLPGLPIAIRYPQVPIYVIEVNKKKIHFLHTVVQELQLTNVSVCDLDWRTFLRKTAFNISVFCARASLQPDELVLLFKPSCFYRDSLLVYWASRHYKMTQKVALFYKKEASYTVHNKKRRFIFFGAHDMSFLHR